MFHTPAHKQPAALVEFRKITAVEIPANHISIRYNSRTDISTVIMDGEEIGFYSWGNHWLNAWDASGSYIDQFAGTEAAIDAMVYRHSLKH